MRTKTLFSIRNLDVARFPCIHDTIKRLKSWNFDKINFLTGQFSFSFDSINRNFLKNLFFKRIKDNIAWYNINKIIDRYSFSNSLDGFYFTNDIIV